MLYASSYKSFESSQNKKQREINDEYRDTVVPKSYNISSSNHPKQHFNWISSLTSEMKKAAINYYLDFEN